jgi:hypothetical protein
MYSMTKSSANTSSYIKGRMGLANNELTTEGGGGGVGWGGEGRGEWMGGGGLKFYSVEITNGVQHRNTSQ